MKLCSHSANNALPPLTRYLVAFGMLIIFSLTSCHPIFLDLEPATIKCIKQHLTSNTAVKGIARPIDEDRSTFRFWIKHPTYYNKGYAEKDGEFEFSFNTEDSLEMYQFCFFSSAPKPKNVDFKRRVEFNIIVEGEIYNNPSELHPVQDMLEILVKKSNEFSLKITDDWLNRSSHKEISDYLNSTIIWLSLFIMLMMVVAMVYQIYYIQKYLKVRDNIYLNTDSGNMTKAGLSSYHNDDPSSVESIDILPSDQNDVLSQLPTTQIWTSDEYFGMDMIRSRKKTDQELKQIQSDRAKKFYLKQNKMIESLELLQHHELEECTTNNNKVIMDYMVQISLIVNVVLCILNIGAAYLSKSMSVIAIALDSVFDIISSFILVIIAHIQKTRNIYTYPIGKNRLEPLGTLVFSCFMFSMALQLVVESVKRIIWRQYELDISLPTVSILACSIIIKLVLFICCRFFSSQSIATKTLAQDHLNDIICNSGMTVFLFAGYYVYYYLDPIWAICVGIYIMLVWCKTCIRTIRMLMGYRASDKLMKKWTFICLQHDPRILAIDTVRAYRMSEGYVVEIDIVLPGDMTLSYAHDIGESLQFKLEGLNEVDRAFVHVDYSSNHAPEH